MRALVISGMVLIAATYGLARFGYGLILPRFTATFRMDSVIAGFVRTGSLLSFCLAAVPAGRGATGPGAGP